MLHFVNHPINRTKIEMYSESFDIKVSVLKIEKIYQSEPFELGLK